MKQVSMEQRFCVSLVAFAVIVRMLSATGVSAALDRSLGLSPAVQTTAQPEVFLLEILAAEPVQEVLPDEASAAPLLSETLPEQTDSPTQPESSAPAEPLLFSAQEADEIPLAGACSYTPDKQALLLQPTTLNFQQSGPTVLIVHTHSSEAYTMEAGFEYPESDSQRTQDERYSVIRVGEEIAACLTQAGINVLHDTHPNDYPNYSGSYERMRQTIEQYLADYPTLQMVLDIHRDAAEDANGDPVSLSVSIDGRDCAALMLVVGTDEGGLSHPNWQENLANALKLQALLNRTAPGLCRNLDLRTERFNQHETPGSLLIEVGASGNTLSEALRSAQLLSDALITFIQSGNGE